MSNRSNMNELRDLLSGVRALEQQETEETRAAYRQLLFRLARNERSKRDTADEIHRVVKEAGRSATQFLVNVEELRALAGLAEEARRLTELRDADGQAAAELRVGREEHERVVKEAKASLEALQRKRDAASTALYAADDAQRALLQRLGLDRTYEHKLDALAAAEAQDDVERCRAEVWEVWKRALALHDYNPFHDAPVQDTAPPLRSEGCEWQEGIATE